MTGDFGRLEERLAALKEEQRKYEQDCATDRAKIEGKLQGVIDRENRRSGMTVAIVVISSTLGAIFSNLKSVVELFHK